MVPRPISCQVTRKARTPRSPVAMPAEGPALISEALSRVYGDLPHDPLPEPLLALVERLRRALTERS